MTWDTNESAADRGPWKRRGCGRMQWKPLEIGAAILGFATYWPLGVAVVAYKVAQGRGYAVPDLFGAMNARFNDFTKGFGTGERKPWRPFAEPSSGNAAFDDWRMAELAKLDEERRKLHAAEREFTEHMDTLRRARDREEFDRFMQARSSRPQD